ncbi:MAG TPA: NAD(P)H-hydrate dehydratase [Oscillospiraceae bacterium]|nr:NAD(P)H-hydrate dehydratase [Oscillospiraceae bacterium]
MKVLDCKQIRALEQSAVDEGADYLQLMENAGTAVVRYMRKKYVLTEKRVVVLCGKGNNGGDGYVAARHLSELGASVTVILTEGLPATELAKHMFDEIHYTKVKVIHFQNSPELIKPTLASADFIIDAIYGIGFHGSVPETILPIFQAVENSKATVIAADMPSGAQCDTGVVEGACIHADDTVTFSTLKIGQLLQPAKSYCGQITVVSVGISAHLISNQKSNLEVTELETVKQMFHPRNPESNKGDYGRLLCICGSDGMAGAAVMSAKAAIRCGTGLVNIALPRSIYSIVSSQLAEPVFTVLDTTSSGEFLPQCKTKLKQVFNRSTACLIGCGIGTEQTAENLVYKTISRSSIPLIIDADGINAIAANIDVLKTAKAPIILTPHPGEMARLLNTTAADVQAHRFEYASKFAAEYQVIVVLKGSGTVIALPNGRLYVNPTGNAGMAKGGSGDVLAGMIAAFTAQSVEPYFAAICGVYLHGLVGDNCAQQFSQRAMLPTDMINELPKLFLEFE